ncbi:MAG: hypothetical protein AAF639_41960 [Chloroflexota bacterium]
MTTSLYLDTTIQLTKLFAPSGIQKRILNKIRSNTCVTSRYVRMEYLRWLGPCLQLHHMLQEELQDNPESALDEVQARILLVYGRDKTKMLSILTLLSRTYGRTVPQLFLIQLETLIERKFAELFDENVTELPDPISCPLMDLRAIPLDVGYRLDPDIPYRRGEMPCHIVDFLQGHREQLEVLAPALRGKYPKLADACQQVLANPAEAQGNTCKTLGDVIIALQTPPGAILWTTDASFDVICPVLGIEHVREPLR